MNDHDIPLPGRALSKCCEALAAMTRQRDELQAAVTDWMLIADGVAHDPRCEDGRPCLRCQAWEGKRPATVDIDAALDGAS